MGQEDVQSSVRSPLLLDHVGVLVADFDAALQQFGSILIGDFTVYEDDEPLDCRWARLSFANSVPVEIVAPRSDASPFATDLRRRGPGLHHISFRVDDIAREQSRLTAAGTRVLGMSDDHSGWKEFFVHPRDASETLIHFCVPPLEHLPF